MIYPNVLQLLTSDNERSRSDSTVIQEKSSWNLLWLTPVIRITEATGTAHQYCDFIFLPNSPPRNLETLDGPGGRSRFALGMPAPGMPVPMDARDHGFVPSVGRPLGWWPIFVALDLTLETVASTRTWVSIQFK
ncbi:hypothetical protein HOLleu_33488 [Holothuria leucospilota]|uniref:Uncharacterized protein n=1 Tax=Holothuria leucospilota TaxID=206669 RepID=A0A9Q0YQB6_HOLLE|nr:hypothetical protein HOLleu_33488 [Holothuria leucospilota]